MIYSSFKRPERVRIPRAPAVKGTVVHNGPAALVAAPKPVEHRNPRLLALADNRRDMGRRCLLCVLGVCEGPFAPVVACHSNFNVHAKGGARKADDHYSAWGCAACHRWLDQGPAEYAVKAYRFEVAHAEQAVAWGLIAMNPREQAADRAAAQWALDRLREDQPHGA
jgi:hypothetical protein